MWRNQRFTIGVILCLFVGTLLGLRGQMSNKPLQRVSILFHPHDGYEIDGKRVVLDELEGVLRKSIRAKSRHALVTVLLHEQSRISDLSFLRGLLQAIGYLNIRFYEFNDARKMMAELVVDRPAIPFSLAPTTNVVFFSNAPPKL